MEGSSGGSQIAQIVRAQIVFLLSTLTEENYVHHQHEIRTLCEQHGKEMYVHFLRRLVSHAFTAPSELANRLLTEEVQRLSTDPVLARSFADAADTDMDVFRHFDLGRFIDRVGLVPFQRVVLASALVPGAARLASQAAAMIRADFDNAVIALAHGDHQELSPQRLHALVSHLLVSPPPDSPVLDAAQRQALLVAAQTKYGPDTMPPILSAVLPAMQLPPNTSLVALLVQLGPDLTANPDVIRAVLPRFGMSPPHSAQLVDIFATLARLATEGQPLCDVLALVRALTSFGTPLDWASVIRSFDRQDRHGVDAPTLKLIIAVLASSPADADPHAVTGFWTPWNNALYQLRLLDALLSLPADTFNFVSLPGRRIVTVDDVAISSPTIKTLAANVQAHTWNSLDLFEVLVRLAGDNEPAEIRQYVREMLDKAIKISAELVHMGLLLVPNAEWNQTRVEYTHKLLNMFLAGHPNHQLVFMRMWQIEPSYLTNAFRDFYHESPLNITRILDVAQDLKILESLLEVQPFEFALDVAALASRREYLNLDKWLADKVSTHGADFLHSIISFLEQKMDAEKASRFSTEPQVDNRTMPLNPSTITIILRLMRNSANLLDPNDIDYCREVRNTCLQIHPRLMSLTPPTMDSEPGLNVVNYTSEIEGEVDSIYRQMYEEKMTIDEVIAMLEKCKESSNPHDHEIFACMLHFLFDEYKFFQSYYPARELAMTGYLLGSLIQHKLVDSIPLGIAIRYVLDALHCPPETNLFKFGLQALARFEPRLAEWQPLCERLLEIPQLVEARPELVGIIQRALSAPDLGSGELQGLEGASGPIPEMPPVFVAINPDRLDEGYNLPPEEDSDRILFIVNNLAPSNFESKILDMRDSFHDDYARWFANYLVDQRVASEPNNHSLYLRFLDAIDSRPLHSYILYETYVKSAALLNHEKSMQSGIERNTLKNIATWLGLITLARDRPVKFKNLSFKELLIEGYDSGRVVVAITFVCHTLQGCVHSKVFKPPNPWLMAVVSLLVELYRFADLKLNPVFEIERLCSSLDIDLDKIEASTIIRTRPSLDSLAGPGLPEYPPNIDSLPMGGYGSVNVSSGGSVTVGGGLGVDPAQQLMLGGPPTSPTTDAQRAAVGVHLENILSELMMRVQINPQLAPFHINPTFKRAVQTAVDRSVREIILPVVERSVTISGISTHELVVKDFATEPHEERLRKAAHLMAQKLASSLASVTCKEPLKGNLATHMRQVLVDHGFGELCNEQVIMLLVNDNWNIACQAIEKAAMERAASDVDAAFADSVEVRRRHRQIRSEHQFWDPAAASSSFSLSLPDPLRVRPNGVQPIQFNVYEDFGADERRRMMIAQMGRPASAGIGGPGFAPSPAPQASMQYLNHQQAMDRFAELTRDVDAVVAQLPVDSLMALPPNHDLRHLLRQIILLPTTQAMDRQRTPLYVSQKTMQLLYKTTSSLGREVYVALLEQLCTHFEDVAKEVIGWLLYSDDERKFNIPVTVSIIKSGLIDIETHDQVLAKMVANDPRPSLQNFTAGLVRELLTSDPPVASQNHLPYLIDILAQLAQTGKATEEVNLLMDDLHAPDIRRAVGAPVSDGMIPLQPSVKPEIDEMRENLYGWFQQWVQLYQRSTDPEKNFVSFATSLTKAGVMKADESSSFFFRVCVEAAVNSYVRCTATGEHHIAFQSLDALACMIVYMIKYQGDASGVNNDQAKVVYLSKILSIFVLVLSQMHEEQDIAFQPKPIFRLFSTLMHDLEEADFGHLYVPLLVAMGESLNSLQPTFFPGFSFHWLCLISHRLYMPKLLQSENREGWSVFHKQLCYHFKFLTSIMKEGPVSRSVGHLYRGTLRVMLVLLHDFPEFLSEYYFTLCDTIPARYTQLRNIVLSAFPPNMELPDPYLQNLKFELIPDMGPIPPVLSDFTANLKADVRSYLDQFLLSRESPNVLASLIERIHLSEGSAESYNVPFINSLVMYIGVSAVAQAKARGATSLFNPSDSGVIALQYLASSLDSEGQYHLLCSMALHLRYPNAHTHWFSCLLLYLFTEADEQLCEVITRVLLERFVVHRPHPWGAMMTFIELLRNPKYNFWTKNFVHVAPEITALLENVGRSIFLPS